MKRMVHITVIGEHWWQVEYQLMNEIEVKFCTSQDAGYVQDFFAALTQRNDVVWATLIKKQVLGRLQIGTLRAQSQG